MKKRYTLIDNESKKKMEYSRNEFNLAWVLLYLFGIATGMLNMYLILK
tara:strand:+ start:982 stop:1125 length:144 start_codon:yes stop_codon:yes gene_type:complete